MMMLFLAHRLTRGHDRIPTVPPIFKAFVMVENT